MSQPKTGKRIALLAGCVVVVVVGVAAWECREDIRFWWLFEAMGQNDQGYSEYRHRQTGIVFVSLPGETFLMGAQNDNPDGRNYDRQAQDLEGPVHKVELSPFMIAKYEVTQAQWEKEMSWNPSYHKGPALPMEQIFWKSCQDFCRKTGLKLPTEAQWEYACRAGKKGPFSGTGNFMEMSWHEENSGHKVHPVGQKKPNDFGLYDMHGNVSEWCEDLLDKSYYSKPEASEQNPLCTSVPDVRVVSGGSSFISSFSDNRVIRGGSYYDVARNCRSAYRSTTHISFCSKITGFRPVWSLP